MRCPTCKRQFQPDQSTAKPFCSERCRLIDLGRWLDEGYALPAISDPEEQPDPDGDHSEEP